MSGQQSSGGRPPKVTDEEIINTIKQSEYPSLTSKEVADELDISTGATRKRLKQLQTNDQIEGRQTPGDEIWLWCHEDSIGSILYMSPDKKGESDTIGFEVIDAYNFRGNPDIKKRRRQSMCQTARFLFEKGPIVPDHINYRLTEDFKNASAYIKDEVVPSSDLRTIAWTTAPQTAKNKESLWKKFNLSDTAFFEYLNQEHGWMLSMDGFVLKRESGCPDFVEAWQESKSTWKELVHYHGWNNASYAYDGSFRDFELTSETANISQSNDLLDIAGCSLTVELDLGEYPWLKNQGEIRVNLTVSDEFSGFKQFKTELRSNNENPDFVSIEEGSTDLSFNNSQCEVTFSLKTSLHLKHESIQDGPKWAPAIESETRKYLNKIASS